MIRALLMLGFWTVALALTALLCFPYTVLTGDVRLLYRVAMWCTATGVRLTGVRVETEGLEKLTAGQGYLFLVNHVSTLDPPLLLPRIPGRTSVMAKQELFRYPLLGRAMRMGSMIPVDRGSRDAGIAAVREAKRVLRQGISMTIFVEGHRSFDGRLLPFKKGPFYLAMECGVPVVPVTVVGTHAIMPKGRLAIRPGTATLVFHEPMDPARFADRDALLAAVREKINAGLPEEYRFGADATKP